MAHRPAQDQPWHVRPWQAGDLLAALTALLHRAFAPLAAPTAQGQGIGAALLQACEQWAVQGGHRAIALDTAAPAGQLRQRYQRDGYAEMASVQWDSKACRSVVMVKALGAAPVTKQDPAHRAASVRSFWAQVQARDWAGARALLADKATLHWPASSEHRLDADAIHCVNALCPEGWALQILAVTPWLVQADETRATVQAPPAWRSAEAIGACRRDAIQS